MATVSIEDHNIHAIFLDEDKRSIGRTIRVLELWTHKDGTPMHPSVYRKNFFGATVKSASEPVYRAVELTNEGNPAAVGLHVKIKESTLEKRYKRLSH